MKETANDLINYLSLMLCPPGEGVYAVTSGSNYKEKLYELISAGESLASLWRSNLIAIASTNQPLLLGIPSDVGGGILRGANWGPLFIRLNLYPLLNKNSLLDVGDVRVIPHFLLDEYVAKEQIQRSRKALYQSLDISLPVSPLSITERVCQYIYKLNKHAKLLSLGGDHSISYPLIKSFLQNSENTSQIALIHFDAHTDLLEERLGVPVNFGSWAYHILKELYSSQHIIQVGIRASRFSKIKWFERYGVRQLWAQEINHLHATEIMRLIQEMLSELSIRKIYISFDIDVMDNEFVSQTGTPEPNGLVPDKVYQLIDLLCNAYELTGADIVEVAPFTRPLGYKKSDQTLEIASQVSYMLLKHM